ncbi:MULTISPECIES: AMP-binding protein [unclassified Microbulbifer]|uniref:AMP-binding protein n=1 Tax=unclassified Microbulbifer TaxID=2619833 RepID=UPI0027E5B51A|nr:MULTISPECIES: AMP-binding protein [unclassified Microbulbifer]
MQSHLTSTRGISDSLPRYDSLVAMLYASVERTPDRTALICEGRSLSYAELGRAVTGLALRLRETGHTGERLAVMLPNSIETVVASFAVMAAGAQLAPLNPFFTHRELLPIVSAAEFAAIICSDEMREKAGALASEAGVKSVLPLVPGDIDRLSSGAQAAGACEPLPAPDSPALLIHTGGTTGAPKGVDHTHRSLLFSIYQHAAMWPLEFGGERFLSVAPMFHIWGLGYATLVPVYASGTNIIVPRYDPERVLRALGDHKVTVFGGGPAPIYAGLASHPLTNTLAFSSLKYSLTGGAPSSAELHRKWRELTGCDLYEGWGMSEGAPLCLNPGDREPRPMSVGHPVPETELQIVDLERGDRVLSLGERGELRVRGPQVMRGYRNRSGETAATLRDGWLYTGDIGYVDSEGYVYLVDRKKDMIISGGYNVYPREVDECLVTKPGIAEAAAVGKPEERLGEVLVAFVALEAGVSMSEEDVLAYCAERLVKYKRPVEVHFVDSLPRTGVNKIDRLALREMAISIMT